jgi:hypothetical protein
VFGWCAEVLAGRETTSGTSDDNGMKPDEDLNAQIARMRELLRLMAPEASGAGALGATGERGLSGRDRPVDAARDGTETR